MLRTAAVESPAKITANTIQQRSVGTQQERMRKSPQHRLFSRLPGAGLGTPMSGDPRSELFGVKFSNIRLVLGPEICVTITVLVIVQATVVAVAFAATAAFFSAHKLP